MRRRSPKAVREERGTGPGAPHPLERQKLRVAERDKRRGPGRSQRRESGAKALVAGTPYLLARLNALLPVRVWKLYSMRHGPLMAAGSAYNMFFSVAAMLVVGFSVFALIASGSPGLRDAIISVVNDSTPGLIDTGSGGLVTPEQLFSPSAFGITLVVSTVVMILTSLGWIAGLRGGMRAVFGLPPLEGNPVLIRLGDIGTLLILGIALVITSAAAAAANTALDLIVDLLHLERRVGIPLAKITGILVMLFLDTVVAGVLFRVAARLPMSRPVMLQAALIAAVASTVLRYFASYLLGSAGRNPLLAPFAVILGLFIWFYFLNQAYLIAAAWGAVRTVDAEAHGHLTDNAPGNGSIRQRSRQFKRAEAEDGNPRHGNAGYGRAPSRPNPCRRA